MADAKNRAALATPTRFQIVDLREANDSLGHTTIATRREAHLARRFGVRPAIAGLVASLVYGEARA